MMLDELLTADVTDLCAHLRAGRYGPSQIMAHYVTVAQRRAGLHALVGDSTACALEAAQAAEQAWRAGTLRGPLAGVPFVVKDNLDVRGHPTSAGSVPPVRAAVQRSAAVVQRLERAGAIVLGKAHCVELALGGWGTNTSMGTPLNPWSPDIPRVCGGSSSGSAAAVAAGMAPFALGTDTGGSIRTPAAWCGLTGFKPTQDAVSGQGVVPLSTTLDTVGPLCRSARDVALLMDVMRRDGTGEPGVTGAWADDLRHVRLARLPDSHADRVAPEIWSAYLEVLTVFAQGGAEVALADLPCSLEQALHDSQAILSYEAYAAWRHRADDPTDAMDSEVRPRILSGRTVSDASYQRALSERRRLIRATRRGPWADALLLPTVTTGPPLLAGLDGNGSPAYYSRYANFLDLPALALPCGLSPIDRLPMSVQLVGLRFDENKVLALGMWLQRQTAWHCLRPTGQ